MMNISILTIGLLFCSSCILLEDKTPLPKKGYTISIFRTNKDVTIYKLGRFHYRLNGVEKYFKQATLDSTPVVLIECYSDMKFMDLTETLEILSKLNIEDIYIVPMYPIEQISKKSKVTCHLNFPEINIELTDHETPKPNDKDDREFSDKFYAYFHKGEGKSEKSIVIKSHPEVRQYWVNRVLDNLFDCSQCDFIFFETNKHKYKTKNIRSSTYSDEIWLFEPEEVEPPPPPPGEK